MTRFCVWVKTPDGKKCECVVVEWNLLSYKTLLPMMGVKALHGRPFDGQNFATIPQMGWYPSNKKQEDKI